MKRPRDIEQFLNEYDGDDEDNLSATDNIRFHYNILRCKPDGLLIDELHKQWRGDYDTLEDRHGFIQWLFPIREQGMNYSAQPLQLHEIAAMRSDPAIINRVYTSYELMLDFYGLALLDRDSGRLGRTTNYQERYEHLCWSSHNYLRITRILKCLGELGLEHLNVAFLLHILNEQSEHHLLLNRRIMDSMDRWWANCIRNPEKRQTVGELIERVRSGDLLFNRQQYIAMLQPAEPQAKDGEQSLSQQTVAKGQ